MHESGQQKRSALFYLGTIKAIVFGSLRRFRHRSFLIRLTKTLIGTPLSPKILDCFSYSGLSFEEWPTMEENFYLCVT